MWKHLTSVIGRSRWLAFQARGGDTILAGIFDVRDSCNTHRSQFAIRYLYRACDLLAKQRGLLDEIQQLSDCRLITRLHAHDTHTHTHAFRTLDIGCRDGRHGRELYRSRFLAITICPLGASSSSTYIHPFIHSVSLLQFP